MSSWQEQITAQFPELGDAPSNWTLIDAAIELGSLLEKAARAYDKHTCQRVLELVLWADKQTSQDESFIYFCQDVLRHSVLNDSARSTVASILNNRSLAQLRGYVEYVASKETFSQLSKEVRLAHNKG